MFYTDGYVSCLHVQMRRVVCERLASLTRIRTLDTTDKVDIKVDSRDIDMSNDVKHVDLTSSSTSLSSSTAAVPASAGPSISSVERLLGSISDLLETRLRTDSQRRHQREKDQQMMSEWMIAAAVIDRICFIVFSITLVVASLVFTLLLLFHA